MGTNRRGSHRRGMVALVASAVAVAATSGYWLYSSGTISLAAAPAVGTGALGGATATFTPLDVSAFQTENSGNLAGYALGQVTAAAGYEDTTRLYFSWTDPQQASNPLNYCGQKDNASSCDGWIAFGLYYPVHSGTCLNQTSPAYIDAKNAQPPGSVPLPTLDLASDVTITHGSSTYCAALDTGATGHLVGSSQGGSRSGPNGQVLVSEQMLGSYLTPGTAIAPSFSGSSGSYASSVPCGTSVTGSASPPVWCTPSAYAADQENIFFVLATVVLPGYNVAGQQSAAGTMRFYFSVS